jgi:hypothetical protein
LFREAYRSVAILGTNIALPILPENAGAGRMKRIILCLGIFSGLIADVNARDLGQWKQ